MQNNTPTLYIIRGIPGSGKSTLAKKLAPVHLEADMFWGEDYQFDISRIKEAHAWCKMEVHKAMDSGLGMDIAVSNTFVKRWEMEPYIGMATHHGYTVHEIICRGNFGNIHNVPEDVVERMKRIFEF